MSKLVLIVCRGFAILLLPLLAFADGQTLHGYVSRIMDGDRLQVITREGARYPVRLQGIAAPASDDRASARASKRSLEMLLAGKPVTLHYKRRDERGNILGTVTLGGMDAALRQLERGMVRFSDTPTLDGDQRKRYRAAERQARERSMGLWKQRRSSWHR